MSYSGAGYTVPSVDGAPAALGNIYGLSSDLAGLTDLFIFGDSIAETIESAIEGQSPLIAAGAPTVGTSYLLVDQANYLVMPTPDLQACTYLLVAASPINPAADFGCFLLATYQGPGETQQIWMGETTASTNNLTATVGGDARSFLPAEQLNTSREALGFYCLAIGSTGYEMGQGFGGAMMFRQSGVINRAAGSVNPTRLGASYNAAFGSGDRSVRIGLVARFNGTKLTQDQMRAHYVALRARFKEIADLSI